MIRDQHLIDMQRRGASLIEHERMLRTQREVAERARLRSYGHLGPCDVCPTCKVCRRVECEDFSRACSECGRLTIGSRLRWDGGREVVQP